MNQSSSTETKLCGVLPVLCTPFTEDGALDEPSLVRVIEHDLGAGVHGIVCLGLAGEGYKLTDDERRRVLSIAVDTVSGQVPVVAGAEHNSIEAVVRRCIEAEEAGADALMMYPPSFVTPNAAEVEGYYAAAGQAVDLPIVVQDAPAWTRVPLPVDVLVRIRQRVPNVASVKVESPPTAVKIDALHEVGFTTLGGYGALHLAEELSRGIAAFMPGCALPEMYVRLWELHEEGNDEGLWSLYTAALPLLTFQMSSLDTFVNVQKDLLHRAGVLSSPRLRSPGAPLPKIQKAWLDTILARAAAGVIVTPTPSSPGKRREP